MNWYIRALRKYAVFAGRAGRREFWMYFLWNFVFVLAAAILDHGLDIATIDLTDVGFRDLTIGPISVGYALLMLVPNLAIQCRRIHDIGKTGWLQLVGVIPYVGAIILVVILALPGNGGPNKFGPVQSPTDEA